MIAQSLIAASKTVAPDREPHSIHGYFIAPGDIHQDLLFDVEGCDTYRMSNGELYA